MTTITQATVAAAAAKPQASGATSAADQQDRFMKLLVAQMRNQDPMNPMDNAQMTSQIAQINTVAGLEKLNRTVEGMVGAFSAMQSQSAVQMAGRQVLVEGARISPVSDGYAAGGVKLAAAADRVDVDIVNNAGRVVRTLSLGASAAGVRSFVWDGLDAGGSPAPAGDYRMRSAATAAGQSVGAATLSSAWVNAVVPSASGPLLDLGVAGNVPIGDVLSFL